MYYNENKIIIGRQMQRSWVSSPMGIYSLLSLLKNYNVSKYEKHLQVQISALPDFLSVKSGIFEYFK